MDIRVQRGLSLSESATEKLARAIFIGHFQPGHHLVEVRQLGVHTAQSLMGVSLRHVETLALVSAPDAAINAMVF